MNNANGPVLEAMDLAKTFHDGARELKILRGVDLRVELGESTAIVGVSGSGKSTLLHLLAGLDRPTEGVVRLAGQDYSTLRDEEIAHRRARAIGIIYQFHHLLPEFNALENVLLPALVAGKSRAEARRLAAERLDEVGLSDRLSHRPGKLSGGEQQRVALARSLVNDPLVVLADEPTGNLDADTAAEAIDLLWKSTLDKDRALVIVTHEPSIARRADRVLELRDGLLHDRTDDPRPAAE
jgi:lipoprotein-releasing system ATP-binding protein